MTGIGREGSPCLYPREDTIGGNKKGSVGEVVKDRGGQTYGDRKLLDLDGENTKQYRDVLKNCTLETYVILLTNVTPIYLTQIFKKKQ